MAKRGVKLDPSIVERAAELRSEGKTLREISTELRVNRNVLSEKLSEYHRESLLASVERAAALKGLQVARLEFLIQEATKGWLASRSEIESVRETLSVEFLPSGERIERPTEKVITRKQQAGDARFLAEIRELMRAQREILGIRDDTGVISDEKVTFYLPVNGRESNQPTDNGDQAATGTAREVP